MTLREMRDRANLSCVQVGKKLFVDQSCVRHWEYGDWAPARKYYKKMAKLYGVSEDEIKAAAEAIRAANRGEKRDNQCCTEVGQAVSDPGRGFGDAEL